MCLKVVVVDSSDKYSVEDSMVVAVVVDLFGMCFVEDLTVVVAYLERYLTAEMSMVWFVAVLSGRYTPDNVKYVDVGARK